METPHNAPTPQAIEEYRRQMMAMFQRSAMRSAPEEDWLNSRFPEPDFRRDHAIMVETVIDIPDASVKEPPPPLSATPSPFVGYLRVFAFTAEQAEPIPNARVAVTRDDTLFANVETDRDGYTPVIPLPSVDPSFSLRPDGPTPYIGYDIQVNAEGFRTVRHENVPVYGNNYVTQPIALLPLLPNTPQPPMQNFISGGPTNL